MTNSRKGFIELQDLIRGTFAHCDRAFIVIDAFDACSIETRTEITKTLRDIHDHVSLLYTCQNSGNLNKLLPVEAILEISAADRDVRQYVLSRIDQSHTLQERVSGDIRLLDEICNAVMDTCRGMLVSKRHALSDSVSITFHFLWLASFPCSGNLRSATDEFIDSS